MGLAGALNSLEWDLKGPKPPHAVMFNAEENR